MNKGRIWPHCRAIWMGDGFGGSGTNPPCWMTIEAVYQFIIDITHPLDITTVNVFKTYARWSYIQDGPAIEWKFDWTDGDFDGFIKCQQINVESDQLRHWKVIATLNYSGLPPFGDSLEFEGTNEFQWSPFGGFGNAFQGFGVQASRWVGYEIFNPALMTYGDIRIAEFDADDTSPRSWNT